MISKWKHQVLPIQIAVDFFNEKETTPKLIVLPTAWGKSILSAFVAKEITDNILILQPSKELLGQNFNKFKVLDDRGVIYSASFKSKNISRVTFATIGSIYKIGSVFKKYGIKKMLIDEAHLFSREDVGMLSKFIVDSSITHVLGITATPLKLHEGCLEMLTTNTDTKAFYDDILYVCQIAEIISYGFWTKLRYMKVAFDKSLLKFDKQKGDFSEDSVNAAYDSNKIAQKILSTLHKFIDRKKVLIFVPSVAEAIRLSRLYPNSAAIYGDMDGGERSRAIDSFLNGSLRYLFNYNVLSTGFDAPQVDLILGARATASLSWWYQVIGRGARLFDCKLDCLIIDFVGNVDRFGKVEDFVFEKQGSKWYLLGKDRMILSGIPISDIGTKFLKEPDHQEKEDKRLEAIKVAIKMPFGTYMGKDITEIPKEYKESMIKAFQWNKQNLYLKKALKESLNVA